MRSPAPTSSKPTPSPRRRSPRPTTACRRWSTSSTATPPASPAAPRSRPSASTASAASSPARSGRPTAPPRSRPTSTTPAFAPSTFDMLRDAYAEQIAGLIDGGADLILIETIFDTLNAKAAVFACEQTFAAKGVRLPLMISGTITDLSGRTLSGQTPTAFWHSLRHARPFSIGLNCALGAAAMREHLAEIAEVADTFVCAYPNAGLPNEFGLYDETPDDDGGRARRLRPRRPGQHRRRLLRLDAGPHRGDRRRGRRREAARAQVRSAADAPLRPRTADADQGHSLRQHRRAHQRHRLGQVPQADHRRRLRRRARRGARPGRRRRADHRRQHGRGPDRLRRGDGRIPQSGRRRARHRPRAGDDRLVEIRRDRGRPEMRAGQAARQFDLDEGGRGGLPAPGAAGARLRRGGRRHGLRRAGPGRHARAQGRRSAAAPTSC